MLWSLTCSSEALDTAHPLLDAPTYQSGQQWTTLGCGEWVLLTKCFVWMGLLLLSMEGWIFQHQVQLAKARMESGDSIVPRMETMIRLALAFYRHVFDHDLFRASFLIH